MDDWTVFDELLRMKDGEKILKIQPPSCICISPIVYDDGIAYCTYCGFECLNKKIYTPLSYAEDFSSNRVFYEPLERFKNLLDKFFPIREIVPPRVITFIRKEMKTHFHSTRIITKVLKQFYPNLVDDKYEIFYRLNNCTFPVLAGGERRLVIDDFLKFTNLYRTHTKGKSSCPSLVYCLNRLLNRYSISFPLLSLTIPITLKDYDTYFNMLPNI